MVLSLSACGKTLKGTDELIEKAREEIPISDSDTIDIQYAGMCGNDNRAIAWFISGNEYQKHYYLPMEVEVKENATEYTFIRTHKPIDDRIGDIAYIQWGDGYAFIVNNTKRLWLIFFSFIHLILNPDLSSSRHPHHTTIL